MVGNMHKEDLRRFMRFVTGCCVCIAKQIKIVFNGLSGLARQPIAHTCDFTLELPTSYINFEDFRDEFMSILSKTMNGCHLTDSETDLEFHHFILDSI